MLSHHVFISPGCAALITGDTPYITCSPPHQSANALAFRSMTNPRVLQLEWYCENLQPPGCLTVATLLASVYT